MSEPDPNPVSRIPREELDGTTPAEEAADSRPLPASVAADLMTLVDQLERLIGTGVDRFNLSLRRCLFMLLGGTLGAIVGTIVLVSLWFALLRGVAGGLAVAMGNRPWAGDLAAGSLGIVTIAVGTGVGLRARQASRRRKLRTRYERRRRAAQHRREAVSSDVA